MNSPSFFERASETTTRKNGRFFEPVRRIRIDSIATLSCGATGPRFSYVTEAEPEGSALLHETERALLLFLLRRRSDGLARHLAHHLQHPLHLDELLEQTVDIFHRRPAAPRNALAPASIEDV